MIRHKMAQDNVTRLKIGEIHTLVTRLTHFLKYKTWKNYNNYIKGINYRFI